MIYIRFMPIKTNKRKIYYGSNNIYIYKIYKKSIK